eukprot:GHVP01053272.1.p1 GENE.GHVP01053272.1~~GHVP01053272.1.p1  ORF type:complete len:381 (-),score=107.56 GHVP01053272.1:1256-2398(-)
MVFKHLVQRAQNFVKEFDDTSEEDSEDDTQKFSPKLSVEFHNKKFASKDIETESFDLNFSERRSSDSRVQTLHKHNKVFRLPRTRSLNFLTRNSHSSSPIREDSPYLWRQNYEALLKAYEAQKKLLALSVSTGRFNREREPSNLRQENEELRRQILNWKEAFFNASNSESVATKEEEGISEPSLDLVKLSEEKLLQAKIETENSRKAVRDMTENIYDLRTKLKTKEEEIRCKTTAIEDYINQLHVSTVEKDNIKSQMELLSSEFENKIDELEEYKKKLQKQEEVNSALSLSMKALLDKQLDTKVRQSESKDDLKSNLEFILQAKLNLESKRNKAVEQIAHYLEMEEIWDLLNIKKPRPEEAKSFSLSGEFIAFLEAETEK